MWMGYEYSLLSSFGPNVEGGVPMGEGGKQAYNYTLM
jgi:hypothetical protein